ncbi:MAG: GGDEF domain-containing protein [Anaerolineae bacterium]|nr:GGDEF domain-containing protein [Anaerolineae bacterium]
MGNLLLARILLVCGACVLAAALIPIRRLLDLLPPGRMRSNWILLMGLALFFILGYVAYGFVFLRAEQHSVDLIVPIIFFFGSIFVILSATLSQQTVVNVRRITMLEQENVTDSLTGVFNRRYLDRRLNEEFARAERYGQPLSALLIDLDNFKMVNDEYGHPAGDDVMVTFANRLLETIRAGDIVARYGGDEFMVIATNTPGPEAGRLAERIRHQFETHPIQLGDTAGQPLSVRITVSIGVSCFCENFADAQSFVACADAMMYKAKNQGRNQVAFCDDCTPPKDPPPPREMRITM